MKDDPDISGLLAGLAPRKRRTRTASDPTAGEPSSSHAYKGQATSYEEKDRHHWDLEALWGPQEPLPKPKR